MVCILNGEIMVSWLICRSFAPQETNSNPRQIVGGSFADRNYFFISSNFIFFISEINSPNAAIHRLTPTASPLGKV